MKSPSLMVKKLWSKLKILATDGQKDTQRDRTKQDAPYFDFTLFA